MTQSIADLMEPLQALVDEASKRGDPEASAGTLATVDETGRPSARIVFVQMTEPQTPVVFVNRSSGKSQQLIDNPACCLSFFWPRLEVQAILEADGRPIGQADCDRLWAKRPRDSQLGAWASRQRGAAVGREALRDRVRALNRRFSSERIPRPEHWIGFYLQPLRLTIWPSGWHRLFERVRYERQADGRWRARDLNP